MPVNTSRPLQKSPFEKGSLAGLHFAFSAFTEKQNTNIASLLPFFLLPFLSRMHRIESAESWTA